MPPTNVQRASFYDLYHLVGLLTNERNCAKKGV